MARRSTSSRSSTATRSTTAHPPRRSSSIWSSPTQHGGFAEGDTLTFFDGQGNISEAIAGIDGSSFDDVIRGIDLLNNPEGIFSVFNNPGVNIFNGGGGNDLLEGRGGADTLNGQSGFDLASYESSPAAVTVRLAGVNGDTQTALASGGDAGGDKLSSIEGLVGSASGDQLTGNSLDNLLAGGLGSDILNGMGGTDTADYSRDHFFDLGDTPDRVEVHLAPGVGAGRVDEFKLQGDGTFKGISTDALISIENVIGTAGNDVIVGNEFDNRLEGREGSNDLDGGLGNDTLIGGSGIDTANYTSHDAVALQHGEQYVIALGLIGRPGSFTLSQPSSLPGGAPGGRNRRADRHRERDRVQSRRDHHRQRARQRARRARRQRHPRRRARQRHPDREYWHRHGELRQPRQRRGVQRRAGRLLPRQRHLRRKLFPLSGRWPDPAGRRDRHPARHRERDRVNRDETINGNDAANVLDGRGGNDIIDGGLGNDVIIGNGGTDTASWLSHDNVGGASDTIRLGLGGADGSYVRTLNTGPFGTEQVVETDVLRSIENVTGPTRTRTSLATSATTSSTGAAAPITSTAGSATTSSSAAPGSTS